MTTIPSRKARHVKRKHWALLVAATTLPLAVTTGAAAETPEQGPAPAVTCTYTPAVPADNFKGIPVFDAKKAAKPYTATLRTSQGTITFQALTDKAPCTTFSFRFLAEHDYFDRSHCHRLTTQRLWVLQCGDPTGTGSGGPGYSFPDENLDGATYPAGTVAMANAGPNTNGSQFFLVWKDTKLSPAYTPFGRVTGGMDVLQRIAAGGEDDQNGPGDGFPTLPVEFKRVRIGNR
ncbi:peptidyl-prolyl cis-trans isomerase B (cyclophilin B) [Kitasatospora herbaricolor]|uniref:peptidylprolyl isomerase n=1 Tax=Kitasatospora herbaricolor TaxID=68217 RepID=UPI00174A1F23|nr:peptidylprolyl isomerase [Kitasatospora herbaricolor]MDQ0310173.1 peptidyl-prolyl cis-trans isomerase B (cyclophilin B) [Kitasatospora herbaricolor]